MIVIKKFYYFNEDIENNNIKGANYIKFKSFYEKV